MSKFVVDGVTYPNKIVARDKIVSNYTIQRNQALIHSMAYELNDSLYLDILQSGIASNSRSLHLPPSIIDKIQLKYVNAKDSDLIVEKWKAVAVVTHLEKLLEDIDPVFEDVHGTCETTVWKECLVTFKGLTLPPDVRRVLILKSMCMRETKGFFVYHGIASSSLKDNIVRILFTYADPNFDQNFASAGRYTVFKQPFNRQFELEMDGIRVFKDNDIVKNKIFITTPLPVETVVPNLLKLPEETLTDEQVLAIKMIVGGNPSNILVLRGTPGSGKTYVLVIASEYIVIHTKGRILFCAQSNHAADVYAEKLLTRGVISPNKICRVVATSLSLSRISPKVLPLTFHCFDDTINEERFYNPKPGELKDYDIIISTIGCSPNFKDLGKDYFDYIFIDEAAQCSEPDTAIVFGNYCNIDTRLVLAGDDRQLGKVNVTKCLSKFDPYISISTMMRLAETQIYQNDSRLMVTLRTNFRSNKHIKDLYSETMYNGELISSSNPKLDSFCFSPILDNQEIPIRFHDCKGTEEIEEESIFNQKEIDLVIKYVNAAMENGLKQCDIGIVTPYKAQMRKIRTVLAIDRKKDIAVHCVATFQGDERRLIICSFVRTNGIGFLVDARRPNTMISRAQHMLIMIGDSENLKQNDYFQHLMCLLEKKNVIKYE